MEDEVTRVERVRFLQGATGHGVFSTLALAGAGLLLALGNRGMAIVAVVVAYGIALNGLSIYGWDRIRARAEAAFARDEEPDRTLTPHRVSAEMKAELVAGLVLVGSLIALLGLLVAVTRIADTGTVLVLAVAALGAGNLLALARAYRTAG